MNQHLQTLVECIQQSEQLSVEEKTAALKSLKDANKELEITAFKLDRTEKVKRTTAILLEETIAELEQKRKAVEVQNRELEVESSLERVRTIAMSMNKRDDMLDVCKTISHQLQTLAVKEIRNVQTAIFYKEKGTYMNYEYYSKHDKTFITETTYRNNEKHAEFAENMQKGSGKFFELNLVGNEVKEWIAYQKTTNVFIDDFLYTASSLNYYWHSLGPVALGISTYAPLKDEDKTLFLRFLKVFELAYRRYLDIEQAEAQAREAEIELALERVRARTMAMQHSDELADASFVLDSQVRALGIKTWGCAFNIYGENESTEWFSSEAGTMPAYKTPRKNVFLRYYNAGQKGEVIHVEEFADEECVAHYNYLCTVPVMGDALMKVKESGGSFPTRQVDHATYFRYGYLLFITLEPVPNAHDIFIRFAKVFEQTYTRFLDLQKAEAQAREAQIETALEKVRSRSLAMHKSDELNEVVSILYKNLKELHIPATAVGIAIYIEGSKDLNAYVCGENEAGLVITNYRLPYFDNKIAKDLNNAIEKHLDFFVEHYSKEEKDSFYEYVFEHTAEFRHLPEDIKRMIFESPAYTISMVAVKYAVFNLNDFEGKILADNEIDIIKRFARVFDQAYTRFLDLQKAEAQAREARIEAGLERVRSRSMAMHNTSELQEVIHTVHKELLNLNIAINGGSFITINSDIDIRLRCWGSGGTADTSKEVHLPIYDKPFCTNLINGIKSGPGFFTEEFTQQEKKEFFTFLLKHEPWSKLDSTQKQEILLAPAGYNRSCCVSQHTSIFIINQLGEKFSEADNDIVKRFGNVFDQTYTRFLDLQKAESATKEAVKQASLDRIRANIASMRTTNDLQKITPLIWNELTILGVPFIRCGVFIMNDAQQLIHTYLATPDGKAIAAFQIPYVTLGNVSRILESWQHYNIYVEHWDEKEFADFGNELVKQGSLATSENYLNTITEGGLYLHCIPFQQGMFYVGNATRLADEEIKLIQSVAAAFSTAYARYEDFNKLEAAKKQVDKTLLELKQAQTQLIQSEKMASLGELTAGIAHEIQNPLNFVNNFSEVSNELIDEMNEELDKGDVEEAKAIAADIKQNLQKITHHGKRADAIVKGMMQHSRATSSEKKPTDINALADEYLRLAYHATRAKDKSFHARLQTTFDESIGSINIVPQDIGTVILNLVTNAFHAVAEKKKQQQDDYDPTVSVNTKSLVGKIEIRVEDNGNGVPENIIEKIFQPFFTTKPTGQGTGLGLSLAYDVVKAHGGELRVDSHAGESAVFIIELPV